MSNSTISAMMMMVGDMSSLNSLPSFNNHHIDDLGLDDDSFHSSVFEIYIPEHYDSQLWSSYEYLNKNAHKFIDCVSRSYLIQGELLRFFIIARPPAVVKSRALSQSQAERPLSLSHHNLKTINEVPTITTTDTASNSAPTSPSSLEPLTILPPLPSSSQNLSFEIQMKFSPPDTKVNSAADQNAVNITEYNPKHSYVEIDMKNDYISSSKSSTSYLRANNNNVSQQQQLNDKRFIGEVIDVSTPFETYIPNRDTVNQKPNYFRLSNGDIVFPIEIPIYIREIYEDKMITLLFKVNRSKNYKLLLSTGNKLDRLLMNETLAVTPSSKVRPLRNFFKQFTLVQPLKLQIQPNIVQIDNSHLVTVVAENTHSSLSISLTDVNIYLFHVQSMESLLTVDGGNLPPGSTPVPVHRQFGQMTKASNHYVGRPLDDGADTPVELAPGCQHTFVLKVSPLSLQQQLAPLDGFYTKIKLAWAIPTAAGHIMSLYDLKVPPPAMSEVMVDLESPSPVRVSQQFQVAFKITNLGAKSKQLTVSIPAAERITRATPPMQFTPPPPPKLSGISVQSTNQLQQSGKIAKSAATTTTTTSTTTTTTTTSSTSISSSQTISKQSVGDITKQSINSSSMMPLGMSKYLPMGSHIQFNEMTTKSLASFDDTQRNSANLICLEKTIYVGDIDSKNSICIFVDFIALRPGIFEIPNITIFDRIEQKQFKLKESLIITCIDESATPL